MSGDIWLQDLREIDKFMPIHYAPKTHKMYSTFSLWDTYRALHPFLNWIYPEVSADFGRSLMSFVDAWGFLPSWQLLGGPSHMMEGDGGSIILGTMAREGIVEKHAAYAAIKASRKSRVDHRQSLERLGFFAAETRSQWTMDQNQEELSVSSALEQAGADSCAARLAGDLSLEDDKAFFSQRANSVFKFWDQKQHVFAPIHLPDKSHERLYDSVPKLFDVAAPYTEGSAFQYSFGAEFDVEQMIEMHGGTQAFLRDLDYFFQKAPSPSNSIDVNVDGNMHGLSIGNEVTMHTPYLYSLAGQAWKTQAVVEQIVKDMFSDTSQGLPGNDDLGAMSIWLVLTMLGFYPVDACSGNFVLGRPFIDEASFAVKNGKFEIRVHNQGDNAYIERATLSGKALDMKKPILTFEQISNEGILEIWMSAKPDSSAVQDPIFN
eukprot:TRINITY_DN13632_c0_g2_i1.p1 TRINITY_DN13632_c0_g2~~TRINITY_DN13632_c0_g2_i1.p1  ORF type:complete len:487 (-),score=90.22 TRINITY_DN13632_c0_g2_i1:56-1354(-)